MERHSISQLPVVRDGDVSSLADVIGSLQDRALLDRVFKNADALHEDVASAMQGPLATGTAQTARDLLRYYPTDHENACTSHSCPDRLVDASRALGGSPAGSRAMSSPGRARSRRQPTRDSGCLARCGVCHFSTRGFRSRSGIIGHILGGALSGNLCPHPGIHPDSGKPHAHSGCQMSWNTCGMSAVIGPWSERCRAAAA